MDKLHLCYVGNVPVILPIWRTDKNKYTNMAKTGKEYC